MYNKKREINTAKVNTNTAVSKQILINSSKLTQLTYRLMNRKLLYLIMKHYKSVLLVKNISYFDLNLNRSKYSSYRMIETLFV